MNTKKIAVTTLVLALLVSAGIFTVKAVKANDNSTYPPLIQKLVNHFNLNGDEVKEVFDQHRKERYEDIKARLEERLNQAVSDGKITQKQKEAIIGHLPFEKRQDIRKQHREEIRAWAEENNIDLSLFHHFAFPGRRPFR